MLLLSSKCETGIILELIHLVPSVVSEPLLLSASWPGPRSTGWAILSRFFGRRRWAETSGYQYCQGGQRRWFQHVIISSSFFLCKAGLGFHFSGILLGSTLPQRWSWPRGLLSCRRSGATSQVEQRPWTMSFSRSPLWCRLPSRWRNRDGRF